MNQQKQNHSRRSAFGWIILSYGIALLVGAFTVIYAMEAGYSQLAAFAGADILATIVIFGFSYFFKNSSFYDAYWSIIPIYILLGLFAINWPPVANISRAVMISVLVLLWGIRLTWNWARGWEGLHHEDWRYVDLQKQTGQWYWLVSFSGIHFFPTLLVFLGCLPLFPIMGEEQSPLNWLDIVAFLFTAGAIGIEFIADEQLRAFVKQKKSKEETLTSGIWAKSRHPNYLGETGFWWGLYLFALAANTANAWMIIGPLAMTALFQFISIPMKEKRMLARRNNYREIMNTIPRWIGF